VNATRRAFLKAGAAASVGLLVPVGPLAAALEAASGARFDKVPSFEPNKWIRVAPDGTVTLITARSEMGQGARTSLVMILAEELEVDWRRIRIEHAIPGPRYPGMRTSGSSSVSDYWQPLRQAGAAARQILTQAAAKRWGVDPAECHARASRITHGRSGRRLTYGELAAAAAKLPVPESPPLKDPSDFLLLGTRVPRVDGPAIVSGRAVFGLDARPPDALVAAVARCPVPGGRLKSFDPAPARSLAGVRDVVPISAGVAVVADSTWAAFKGREALLVEWDEGENARDTTEDYWARLEQAARSRARVTRSQGDVAQALGAAARKLEASYRFSFQAHAPVEPMNCVADVRPGRCEIWVGTQAPNEAQKAAANLLGVPLESVTVHVTLLGGGFGRRLDYDYVPEAVELSRAIGKPVQIVWSRREDMENDRYQPASINELSAGLDAQGRVIAWSQQMTSFHLTMFGPYAPEKDETYEENPQGAYDCPYDVPALASLFAPAKSPVPTGAWRAVDSPAGTFARESFLDEVALAAGRDAVALRRELLSGPDLHLGNFVINRRRLRAVVDLAAEKGEWGRAPASIAGRRVGRGFAANVYGRAHLAQVADVSVGEAGDVRVHRMVCAVDCGQVINLAGLEAQIEGGILWGLSAALKTRITFRNGRIEQHSFADFPVARMRDTPSIEIHVVPSRERPAGMGEPPVSPAAPAVANAIFAATGKRTRKLPVDPSELKV
jgi:isoquinoline 1-oxidoreductase beta subunit